MARARNIKPSFFTNEVLGTLDPIICLLFSGLWCLADRDGILEDRPLRIKAELFPYREGLDINGYLTVLERSKFIQRYEVAGVAYIKVLNFEKHQTPHHTEKAKGYPQPQGENKEQTLTPLSNGESTVPTRSDLLIPDSLIPDSKRVPPAKQSVPSAGKKSAKPLQTFAAWIENLGDEKPIPADDPIFGYAEDAGIPDDFLRITWVEFKTRYMADGKRYKDWREVFRKAVRSNWFKLWWHDGQGYALTTVGQQAMNAMKAKEREAA